MMAQPESETSREVVGPEWAIYNELREQLQGTEPLPVPSKPIQPRTIAEAIGAFRDEPLWDDLMAAIQARRRAENALEN